MAKEKTLLIIRHGKSSWDLVVDDIDRPLTERGVKNAYEMAKRLAKRGEVPSLVISSPANRAMHTALIMTRTWEKDPSGIQLDADLYLPEVEDIMNVIGQVSGDVDSVAVVGHNPAFTEFANSLLPEKIENIPTAGVAVIHFNADQWKDIHHDLVSSGYVDCPNKKQQ